MTLNDLRLSAVSARAVSVVFAAEGGKYRLPEPVSWSLWSEGELLREGVTLQSVLTLTGLGPSQSYTLKSEGGHYLDFHTRNCSGLVDLVDCGADPSGADNSRAFELAISMVGHGGTLRVPAGRWRTGPVFLKSDMTLLLEQGAVIEANGMRETWPKLEARDCNGQVIGSWEGLPDRCYAAVVTAIGASNLVIEGAGTIDGGGDRSDWWQWPKETRDGARRARTLHLIGCTNVTLMGLTVRNSPSWTVHPYRCRDLTASDLTIVNPPDSPNTDGFNPESCENVLMEGIFFSVGDDCIAIKAGKRGDGANDHLTPTRNVVIRHCRMERGHGGVVMGSEMSGGIHDVTVEDCEMEATDRGIRIKTRRGRGGAVSGLRVRRVDMDGVHAALTANAFYFCDADGHDDWVQDRAAAEVCETTPSISDIDIEDVAIRRLSVVAGAFLGLPEAPINGVRLRNLSVEFDPEAEPAVPLMADHVRTMRHELLVAEHADITCEGANGEPGLAIAKGVSL
ncbi:glycoside hydrolase family 28 protein [Roseibium sp.]|uniref:polygalacturonase PglA n=1 Tax=Roseibium sp. TaxID=1936156 RepID=UPI003A97217F